MAIEGFCVRWPLKVARLEVAKAWPLGARGCSLLGLCPLIELQWGRRRPPLTSQPADQELFQLTCNYSEGMRQSSVHQYWSKVCDTNALVDFSSWSLNRMLARTKLSAKNDQTIDLLVFVRSPFNINRTITRHVGDYTLCSSEEDAPREEISWEFPGIKAVAEVWVN